MSKATESMRQLLNKIDVGKTTGDTAKIAVPKSLLLQSASKPSETKVKTIIKD